LFAAPVFYKKVYAIHLKYSKTGKARIKNYITTCLLVEFSFKKVDKYPNTIGLEKKRQKHKVTICYQEPLNTLLVAWLYLKDNKFYFCKANQRE